jgi:hypothetical protein
MTKWEAVKVRCLQRFFGLRVVGRAGCYMRHKLGQHPCVPREDVPPLPFASHVDRSPTPMRAQGCPPCPASLCSEREAGLRAIHRLTGYRRGEGFDAPKPRPPLREAPPFPLRGEKFCGGMGCCGLDAVARCVQTGQMKS